MITNKKMFLIIEFKVNLFIFMSERPYFANDAVNNLGNIIT